MTAKARQLYRDDMGYASMIWIFFALYLGVVVSDGNFKMFKESS